MTSTPYQHSHAADRYFVSHLLVMVQRGSWGQEFGIR